MDYIKAKKKYGQNFLRNEKILSDIVNSVSVDSNDLIIEIGPGMGALTKYLCELNANLLCYEIDVRMKDYLFKYEADKIVIIYDDFMKRNVLEDIKDIQYKNLYVIANIPYYITSPIILKLINLEKEVKEIVLLVQKEVAERICATNNHKEYNAFTLAIDIDYDAELVFPVSRNSFVPVPNVDSAVIKLIRKKDIVVKDKTFYLKFISAAFQNKRKTLKNNLKQYNWLKIERILNELGYPENVRAEEISKGDFKILVNKYSDNSNDKKYNNELHSLGYDENTSK